MEWTWLLYVFEEVERNNNTVLSSQKCGKGILESEYRIISYVILTN